MKDENINKGIRGTYRFIIIICALLVVIAIGSIYFFATPKAELVEIKTNTDDPESIENGVHLRTGFIEAPGMQETITNCTTCHSAQLVSQNRMDKERWETTIDWMQEAQNLWDLGDNEAPRITLERNTHSHIKISANIGNSIRF
jgi:hypothetical protein